MKSILMNRLLMLTAMMMITGFTSAKEKTAVRITEVGNILTTHQWTLVEILQSKDDSVNNITLLLMPCEKDNYLLFGKDGTYQILEGATKCNKEDNDVKGKGSWSYGSEDSTLQERYEGGSKIYKKIVSISDEMLVIEYEGEGKRKFKLTYVSELGKQNKTNNALTTTDGDASQKIIQFIQRYLLSTNRYILVGKKDLDEGTAVQEDDKNGVLQTVALLPFINKTDPATAKGATEINKALMNKAAAGGLDYVITGNILEASSAVNDDKNFIGNVKFEIQVLEIGDANPHAKIFNSGKKKKAAEPGKKRKFWQGLATKAIGAGKGVIEVLWVTGNYKSYQALYRASVVANAAEKTNTTISLFSNVNDAVRQRNYDSTTAVLTAVAESEDDVEEFLADQVAARIKINRIEGSGKKTKVVIEAGGNIHLQKDEILKVMKCTRTMDNGKLIIEKHYLGKIKVMEITAETRAYCLLEDGSKDILEEYARSPAEVLVFTTAQDN